MITLLNVSVTSSAAASGLNWYVKRSGNKQPTLPEEHKATEGYNCYYIDKKVSDGSQDKIIYLTFDAGYENGNVEKILDVLHEKSVPAAFFLLDNIILRNTDLV